MNTIIENTLKKMSVVLNCEQIKILEKTLNDELLKQERQCRKSNEELLKDFLKSKNYENCSSSTIKQYERENKKFISWCSNKDLKNITKKDIEKYLWDYRIEHNVSAITINNMRRYISSFFNFLELEDIIKCNPVRKTKPVKESKNIKKPYSEIEIEELRENTNNLRDRAIIDTLNSTGIRVSELCKMNICDIHDRVAVVRGKGNKERKVYFSERAWHNVNKYLKSRTDHNSALFVNLRKTNNEYKRISTNSIEKMIRTLGENLKIAAYPHKFRRTVASRASNRGMPIQEIQVLLGHSKIDTTIIYCNISENNIRSSCEKYI